MMASSAPVVRVSALTCGLLDIYVMCTKLDIYGFITITRSTPLLLDY